VHIREAATITPAQPQKLRVEGYNGHSLRFELYWNGAVDSGGVVLRRGFYPTGVVVCPFDTFYYSRTSPLVVDVRSPIADWYSFYPVAFIKKKSNETGMVCGGVSFKFFADDQLIKSFSTTVCTGDTGGEDWWWLDKTAGDSGFVSQHTPFYSRFKLFMPESVFYGKSVGIGLIGEDDCSETVWSDVDSMSLTIISGGQYATFHRYDPETGTDIKLDRCITSVGDSIEAYYTIVVDSVDSTGDWVVVKAESNGLTDIDSVRFLPSPVVVDVVPSTVSPGDTADIIVRQRNPDGTLTSFPDYLQFEVGIWEGSKYGTILSSGDTSGYFINIPQPFRFIAADSIDGDSAVVAIRVGVVTGIPSSMEPLNGNPVQRGMSASGMGVKTPRRFLGVKTPVGRSVLSAADFVSNDEWGVGRVTIRKEFTLNVAVDPQRVRPVGTGGNNKSTVTITARMNGKPLPGVPVQLMARPVQNSGGHIHDGDRPVGSFSVKSGKTGGDGKFVSIYTASQFGGIERIIVTAAGVTDSVADTVKVDSLVQFSGAGDYSLTGSTDSHPNNHYLVSQNAISDLISAADSFAVKDWNTTGTMRLNDMSLPWGGLFDIDINWTTPHRAHRIGKSVDIENIVLDQIDTVNKKGVRVHLIVPNVKWLNRYINFMKENNWKFNNEGQLRTDIFKRTLKYAHFEYQK
jgi:hypothetical protein